MNVNDYQKAALRTINPELSMEEQLVNGVMGLNGEAGECIDILKKALFQGHELDKEHLAIELGDVAWYLATSSYFLGYDLETIFKKNIEKLKKRFNDKFDADKSINRADGDI
jgi:NTP pyrophosphatase (non-canonical NTP hydrolase)